MPEEGSRALRAGITGELRRETEARGCSGRP